MGVVDAVLSVEVGTEAINSWRESGDHCQARFVGSRSVTRRGSRENPIGRSDSSIIQTPTLSFSTFSLAGTP